MTSPTDPAAGTPYVLELRQRLTMMVNRYDLVQLGPGGAERPLGFAEQKRMSLRERVTFFSADGSRQPVFTLVARSVLELAASYDITGADGTPIATLTKDAARSLLRSTYRVQQGDLALTGAERGSVKPIARRAAGILDLPWPLPIQFDFSADADGGIAMTVERQLKLRDRYRVDVVDPAVDWRVAGACAVAVDAFMDR